MPPLFWRIEAVLERGGSISLTCLRLYRTLDQYGIPTFCLSYRDVEELLFVRGILVTYEAMWSAWCGVTRGCDPIPPVPP